MVVSVRKQLQPLALQTDKHSALHFFYPTKWGAREYVRKFLLIKGLKSME